MMQDRPTETSRPAVEARCLVKLFGTTPALLQVDLEVSAGVVCALTGGNGSGKTTLLRILATTLRPTAGTALVCGHDVRTEPRAVRRSIDLVGASGGFYPELSALENLRFAAAIRGLDPGEEELRDVLRRAGLARDAAAPARALSTGMLRRLALARVLLTRPRLALLDEPYACLDEEGRRLADEILEEARADGRTALVATHERDRMRGLADLTLVLRNGGLAAAGERAASPGDAPLAEPVAVA